MHILHLEAEHMFEKRIHSNMYTTTVDIYLSYLDGIKRTSLS